LSAVQSSDPWSVRDGFRINAAARSTFVFDIGGEARGVSLGDTEARIGAEVFGIDLEAAPVPDGVLVSGVIDDNDVLGMVRQTESGPVLFARGRAIALKRPE